MEGRVCVENAALECQIAVMLRVIGVQPHMRGWRYIVSAVEMAVEDEEVVHAMTKVLYPAVAAKHGTTAARVERNIRNAIETAWTYGDAKAQEAYFGNIVAPEKGKPTNAAFIAGLATWCVA